MIGGNQAVGLVDGSTAQVARKFVKRFSEVVFCQQQLLPPDVAPDRHEGGRGRRGVGGSERRRHDPAPQAEIRRQGPRAAERRSGEDRPEQGRFEKPLREASDLHHVQVPQTGQDRGVGEREELIPRVFQVWTHSEGEPSESGGLLLRARGMRAQGKRRPERKPRDHEARGDDAPFRCGEEEGVEEAPSGSSCEEKRRGGSPRNDACRALRVFLHSSWRRNRGGFESGS